MGRDMQKQERSSRNAGVVALAGQALTVLAKQCPPSFSIPQQTLERIVMSLGAESPGSLINELEHLCDMGIPTDEVIDRYIPATARRIGEMWCDSEMSFADVTIGSARLHTALRVLETESQIIPPWDSGQETAAANLSAPEITVIVPQGEQHTLGASVAASQFRRYGAHCDVIFDAGEDEVVSRIASRRRHLVALSVSRPSELEKVNRLIKKLRATDAAGSIALGGAVVEMKHADLSALEADIVTGSVTEALSNAGLPTKLASSPDPTVRADLAMKAKKSR